MYPGQVQSDNSQDVRKFRRYVEGDDWGPAIQAAIDAAKDRERAGNLTDGPTAAIQFGFGTYTIRTPVEIKYPGLTFFTTSPNMALLLADGISGDGDIFYIPDGFSDDNSGSTRLTLRNLWLRSSQNHTHQGLAFRDTSGFSREIYIDSCLFERFAVGIKTLETHSIGNLDLYRTFLQRNDIGIQGRFNGGSSVNTRLGQNETRGIEARLRAFTICGGSMFEGMDQPIHLRDSLGVSIQNSWFEQNGEYLIEIEDSEDIHIFGNRVSGTTGRKDDVWASRSHHIHSDLPVREDFCRYVYGPSRRKHTGFVLGAVSPGDPSGGEVANDKLYTHRGEREFQLQDLLGHHPGPGIYDNDPSAGSITSGETNVDHPFQPGQQVRGYEWDGANEPNGAWAQWGHDATDLPFDAGNWFCVCYAYRADNSSFGRSRLNLTVKNSGNDVANDEETQWDTASWAEAKKGEWRLIYGAIQIPQGGATHINARMAPSDGDSGYAATVLRPTAWVLSNLIDFAPHIKLAESV